MITLTIQFETKQELCDFLGSEAPAKAPKASKPKAPKASKPKADQPKEGGPTATQAELRKALKEFANNHDPSEARKFLESRGIAKISEIKNDPIEYGEALEALKAREEELNNG